MSINLVKWNDPIKNQKKKEKIPFFKRYYKSTPVIWRKIGDSILLLGTAITTYQLTYHSENTKLALATLLITWLGKTITNFAIESTDNN